MRRPIPVTCTMLVVLALMLAASAAHAQAIWGTSTATPATEPGYEGYWKYCFSIEWDTSSYGGQGLSHSSVFLGLEDCSAACGEGAFAFSDTAGSGVGDGKCTVYYRALFECDGDFHFPVFPFPTVKFEYYEDGCEPGGTGSATLCFYSMFIPGPPAVHPNHLGIKFGQNTETGPLDGQLPMCEISPVEELTWGTVKALYR
jgi:hypothetical protein